MLPAMFTNWKGKMLKPCSKEQCPLSLSEKSMFCSLGEKPPFRRSYLTPSATQRAWASIGFTLQRTELNLRRAVILLCTQEQQACMSYTSSLMERQKRKIDIATLETAWK